MKIEVQYNEFLNWEFPVKVNHPECEHPYNYVSIEEIGRGEKTRRLQYCNVCNGIGIPDGEDGYDWEHEG